jgi:hypothetical protein
MPSDNNPNNECCPFPGFECDPIYGGRFCDLRGNLLFDNLPSACKPKATCDYRYFYYGKDGHTCCPFEGTECHPVHGGKYCPTTVA